MQGVRTGFWTASLCQGGPGGPAPPPARTPVVCPGQKCRPPRGPAALRVLAAPTPPTPGRPRWEAHALPPGVPARRVCPGSLGPGWGNINKLASPPSSARFCGSGSCCWLGRREGRGLLALDPTPSLPLPLSPRNPEEPWGHVARGLRRRAGGPPAQHHPHPHPLGLEVAGRNPGSPGSPDPWACPTSSGVAVPPGLGPPIPGEGAGGGLAAKRRGSQVSGGLCRLPVTGPATVACCAVSAAAVSFLCEPCAQLCA